MQHLDRVLMMFGANFLATALVGAVGLLLILLGALAIRSKKNRRAAWLALGFGVGFCLFTALVLIRNPHGLARLFAQDFDDPARLERLAAEKLAATDRQSVLPGAWPQWRGPGRDGVSPETGLVAPWPAGGPKILWRKPIKGGYSSLVVVGGRLYTMDRDHHHERVLCFNAETGTEIWSHRYEVNYDPLDSSYAAGPRATPTVFEDRVYTVGATGVMLCLHARPPDAAGAVIWQHDLAAEFRAPVPRWGMACSPLVDGQLVIVQPGGADGSIAAFDRLSGKLVWKVLSEPSGYSSPVAATIGGVRQMICFTGKGLCGLRSTDGRQLWYFAWPTSFDANIATPIVFGNYVFISSAYGTGCALLEVTGGGDSFEAEPIYIKRNKVMRNHHATSVLHNGYLYGFDGDSTALFRCVNVRNADERWYTREVGKGCLICADGHLLILNEDGRLFLVEATPEEFRKKGELVLFDSSQVWALPALADGRLYARDSKELVCVELRK